ncbi:hypothetical protein GF367_00650 [Candidatus Woesearchaeota archaeon]|nr:hypothetical protein [Candidatus Woesearchaeota archaeon]
MVGETPGMKDAVDDFRASRENASQVFSSKLVVDAAEIRRLDDHVTHFLKQLRQDAANHEVEVLRKHAKEFEDELHDELGFLFKATKQDLELYQKILRSLAAYRKELRSLLGDRELGTLAHSELNYADLLLKTAHEKLDTLMLLFKKLQV